MRRGLQPRSGGSGRVAVLALDLITDFDFPDGPAVQRALARHAAGIRALFEKARHHQVPVIYVNDNLGAWRSDAPANPCRANSVSAAPRMRSLVEKCGAFIRKTTAVAR
jgi:nicotinamidase-related amidase